MQRQGVLLFGVRGVGRNGVTSQGSRNSERSLRNLQWKDDLAQECAWTLDMIQGVVREGVC